MKLMQQRTFVSQGQSNTCSRSSYVYGRGVAARDSWQVLPPSCHMSWKSTVIWETRGRFRLVRADCAGRAFKWRARVHCHRRRLCGQATAPRTSTMYATLLNLTHLLVRLLLHLHRLWLFLEEAFTGWSRAIFCRSPEQPLCPDAKFKLLKKRPNHLAIILGAEPASYVDLVNIIIWSTTFGIPFISFYDYTGNVLCYL